MAEFVEVVRNARRLCKAREHCYGCPLSAADEVCFFESIGDPHIDIDLGKIESIIMQWASEHPEPQYPSWEEWQKENFPHYRSQLVPCQFEDCKINPCIGHAVCTKQPIPADIAKKLAIKPKGAKE